MLILHGENIVQSRNRLKQVIDAAREQNKTVERAVSKNLTEAELEELLVGNDLFGTEKLIIIEELHSLPTSNRKKALISMLANSVDQDIVLWEKRALTATMLNKFPGARAEEFKTSSSLFKWLDLLGTDNTQQKLKYLQEAISSDGEYFCFLMLLRQIRMLIQAKDSGKVAGAPFVVNKVKAQARNFSLEQLLQIHQRLYTIDARQKTSRSPLTLFQELDLITLAL